MTTVIETRGRRSVAADASAADREEGRGAVDINAFPSMC